MAIISRRKPFRIGTGTTVVSFPKGWTSLQDEVILVLNRLGLVIPKDMPIEEVKTDVMKLLETIERLEKERGLLNVAQRL